ncbi:hypothetical protein CS8_016320 [Cupriavidus sp. 8B]
MRARPNASGGSMRALLRRAYPQAMVESEIVGAGYYVADPVRRTARRTDTVVCICKTGNR